MSPASYTHTRTASDVTAIVAVRLSHPDAFAHAIDGSGHDARLRSACDATLATHIAMQALSASVANLSPDDPRHAAAYSASDLLGRRWRNQVKEVCRLSALGGPGLRAKSILLSRLIDRDADDAVLGGPVVEVAASLADDILASGGLPGA